MPLLLVTTRPRVPEGLADLFVGDLVGDLLPVGHLRRQCRGSPALDAPYESGPPFRQDVKNLHGDPGLVAALGDEVGPVVVQHQFPEPAVPDVEVRGCPPAANNVAVAQSDEGRRRRKGGRGGASVAVFVTWCHSCSAGYSRGGLDPGLFPRRAARGDFRDILHGPLGRRSSGSWFFVSYQR